MVFEILNYIKNCPYLSDFNHNVDFLGKNPYSLSVSGRCKSESVKKYTDGDMLIKDTYSIKLRLPYGVDMERNLDNCRLLENVGQWFSDSSARGILPALSDGIAISATVEFSQNDAVFLADTAVYTANVAVLYYKTKSL